MKSKEISRVQGRTRDLFFFMESRKVQSVTDFLLLKRLRSDDLFPLLQREESDTLRFRFIVFN